MEMSAEKIDVFISKMQSYAARAEWKDLSEESFLEDIIFMGGVALGESNDAQGFGATIDRLNSRQLFNRGNNPITKESK